MTGTPLAERPLRTRASSDHRDTAGRLADGSRKADRFGPGLGPRAGGSLTTRPGHCLRHRLRAKAGGNRRARPNRRSTTVQTPNQKALVEPLVANWELGWVYTHGGGGWPLKRFLNGLVGSVGGQKKSPAQSLGGAGRTAGLLYGIGQVVHREGVFLGHEAQGLGDGPDQALGDESGGHCLDLRPGHGQARLRRGRSPEAGPGDALLVLGVVERDECPPPGLGLVRPNERFGHGDGGAGGQLERQWARGWGLEQDGYRLGRLGRGGHHDGGLGLGRRFRDGRRGRRLDGGRLDDGLDRGLRRLLTGLTGLLLVEGLALDSLHLVTLFLCRDGIVAVPKTSAEPPANAPSRSKIPCKSLSRNELLGRHWWTLIGCGASGGAAAANRWGSWVRPLHPPAEGPLSLLMQASHKIHLTWL